MMEKLLFFRRAFLPSLIVLGMAAIVFAILVTKKKEDAVPGCNVILISLDSLRQDHLGCYGYSRNTSPEIDRFRMDAVLFRKCIAQSVSTLTSHASLLTALIPSHHQAYFSRTRALSPKIPTLASILKGSGYATVSFNDGGQLAPLFGLNRGFDLYEITAAMRPEEYSFKRIVEKSMEWIDQNPGKRFFLFLHTYEIHHPYSPEARHLNLFEKDYRGDLPALISVELINQINRGEIALSEEDKEHIINTYDAEIRSVDESFADLIRFLKKKGLYDNTVMILTSDHGEEFGEHGFMATHSHTLYNELVCVPLIMKWAHSKFAGRELKGLVRHIDIVPTLLEYLNIKPDGDHDGMSFMPMIRDQRVKREVFAISQRDMLETFNSTYWAIMNEKWKLYDSKLYDLEHDPFEKLDVTESHTGVKWILRKRALRAMRLNGEKTLAGEKARLDEMTVKRLKSLGYIR